MHTPLVLELKRHWVVLRGVERWPDNFFVFLRQYRLERSVLSRHIRLSASFFIRYVVEVLGLEPPTRTEVAH